MLPASESWRKSSGNEKTNKLPKRDSLLDTQEKLSPRDIAAALTERATALWGRERAAVLRPILEETSKHLWELARNPPESDVEPGFTVLD